MHNHLHPKARRPRISPSSFKLHSQLQSSGPTITRHFRLFPNGDETQNFDSLKERKTWSAFVEKLAILVLGSRLVLRHARSLTASLLFSSFSVCRVDAALPRARSFKVSEDIMNEKQLPTVTHDGREYEIVTEGLAEILNPKNIESLNNDKGKAKTQDKKIQSSSPQTVFYNPVQQFNRDLSVLAIRVFAEDHAIIWKAKDERRRQHEEKRGKKRKRTELSDKSASETDKEQQNGVEGHVSVPERIETGLAGQETDSVTDNVQADATDTRVNGRSIGATKEYSSVEVAIEQEDEAIGKEPVSGEDGYEKMQDSFNLDGVPKGPKAVSYHKPSFRVLDALSATGLRALRYAKEISQVTSVVANDLSPEATAAIKINVRHNNLSSQVLPNTANAQSHMYSVASKFKPHLPDGSIGKYEVIDLDPYGTAAPFIDAAVRALSDGGLLCVTCTDSGIFASAGYPEKTFSQYGGLPVKGPQCHEGGLRLVLNAIAVSAARYGIAIEPLLSLSVDFYIRVFVRVRHSPQEVKLLAGKTMTIYNCDSGCGAWSTQVMARTQTREDKRGNPVMHFSLAQAPTTTPTCPHCGFKTHLGGPMWAGPLHNPYFIQRILDMLPTLDPKIYATIPRIEGMLSTARDELLSGSQAVDAPLNSSHEPTSGPTSSSEPSQPVTSPFSRLPAHLSDSHPFFILPSYLAGVLRVPAPANAALIGALRHLGYRTTRSHIKPGSIRTDAPWTVIWEVMREWVRQKTEVQAWKKGTPGRAIMTRGSRNCEDGRNLRIEVEQILHEVASDTDDLKRSLEALLWRFNKQEANSSQPQAASGGTGSAETDTDNHPSTIRSTDPSNSLNSSLSEEPSSSTTVIAIAGPSEQITNGPSHHLHTSEKLKIVFDEKLGREVEAKKLVRYQANPRPNWGPMSRAKGGKAAFRTKEDKREGTDGADRGKTEEDESGEIGKKRRKETEGGEGKGEDVDNGNGIYGTIAV